MNTSVKINRPKLNGISLFIFPNWLKVKFEWWNAQRQGCALSAQWRLTVFLIQTLKELKITARRDGRRAARNIEFFKKNIHEKTHRRTAGPLCASTVAASQYRDRPSLIFVLLSIPRHFQRSAKWSRSCKHTRFGIDHIPCKQLNWNLQSERFQSEWKKKKKKRSVHVNPSCLSKASEQRRKAFTLSTSWQQLPATDFFELREGSLPWLCFHSFQDLMSHHYYHIY